MSRFFRIYFAGVVKSEDVMGGGEAVEAAFGGGERVEGAPLGSIRLARSLAVTDLPEL